MTIITQVAEQRKALEQAVAQALELARAASDAEEVAISKTTGISVSTRYGEVENVEFNSDGALGMTVYHQQRKGSASSTDLSSEAIARTAAGCAGYCPLYFARSFFWPGRTRTAGI